MSRRTRVAFAFAILWSGLFLGPSGFCHATVGQVTSSKSIATGTDRSAGLAATPNLPWHSTFTPCSSGSICTPPPLANYVVEKCLDATGTPEHYCVEKCFDTAQVQCLAGGGALCTCVENNDMLCSSGTYCSTSATDLQVCAETDHRLRVEWRLTCARGSMRTTIWAAACTARRVLHARPHLMT